MRILYVRNLYLPEDFGGNRYPWEVTARLAARGHAVTVVTGSPSALRHPDGVRLVTYRASRQTPLHTFATNAVGALRSATRELRTAAYDVVVHSAPDSAFLYYATKRGRNRPGDVYIYHSRFVSDAVDRLAHGVFPVSVAGRVIHRWMRAVERTIYRNADGLIPVSPFSKTEIEAIAPQHGPIDVISTGVDTAAFAPRDKDEARTKLGITHDAFVLLTVGRLARVKRYDRAIDVLATARAQMSIPLQLLVVGSGPEANKLLVRARDVGVETAVRFEGFQAEDELRLRYAAADVVLCTSDFENWSLSLLEALASGVPVLGVPNGGIPQLLSTVDPSLVMRDSDPATMAAAVRELARDIPRLRSLAATARRVATELYDWDTIVVRLEERFTRLVSGK